MSENRKLNDEYVLELEEKALTNSKDDPWRLNFHLMPVAGWLNDPNGLSEVDGTNHIFFQYTPQDVKKAPSNCWGHYTTKDFVNYTYLLPPLYPDNDYDVNGVYSGSAITTPEGIKAYYTGNVKKPGDYDYILEGREQNLVLAEDYDPETGSFKKKTVLMTNEDFPEDLTLHVRDPKIAKKDGKLYMFLGARDKNDTGLVLVYESEDGREWELVERIHDGKELGYMWECPDGIVIDDKGFLIISPQGIEESGDKFKNIYQSGYIPLDKDKYSINDFIELDHGFDFYAPQTYIDEEGRHILIGWMGIPDAEYDYPTKENGWIHTLTIPRALSLEDGKIIQTPLHELEELRASEEKLTLDGSQTEILVPKSYEFILKDPSEEGEIIINNGCIFRWNKNSAEITFESENEEIKNAGAGRDTRRTQIDGLKNLRVFVDTSSLEFFLNDGKEVFSTRYFPKGTNELEFKNVTGQLTIYELNSFKIERPDGTVLF